MFWEYVFRSGFQTKAKQPAYMHSSRGDTAQICLRRWSWWKKRKKGAIIISWSFVIGLGSCLNMCKLVLIRTLSVKTALKGLLRVLWLCAVKQMEGNSHEGSAVGLLPLLGQLFGFILDRCLFAPIRWTLFCPQLKKMIWANQAKKKKASREALTTLIYWFACEKKKRFWFTCRLWITLMH